MVDSHHTEHLILFLNLKTSILGKFQTYIQYVLIIITPHSDLQLSPLTLPSQLLPNFMSSFTIIIIISNPLSSISSAYMLMGIVSFTRAWEIYL